MTQLENLRSRFEEIVSIRGIGLMVGMELNIDVNKIIQACAENGLLLLRAGENTIRFTPPLIIEKSHIDEAIEILISVFSIAN